MSKYKFAIFDYAKNKNEIELKWNFLKQMPDFIWNWYVQNFCPIAIKNLNFNIANGFLINRLKKISLIISTQTRFL